jgi:PAS domain S-box-containing protein
MDATQFSETIAQSLVSSSVDGLAAIDRELTYLAWNSALSAITGVPAAEAIGRKVFDLFPFLEPLGERDIHRRVFAGETVVVDPRPYDVPEKGRTGYFQSTYWPWKDASGDIVGLFMAIRDVGPSFNRLLFLSELSSALAQSTTPQQTLDISLDFLKRSTKGERGLVVMLTENRQELEVVALNNAGDAIKHREVLDLSFEIPLTVAMRENRPVFSPDEADAQKYSYRHRDYVKFTGDVAAAALPLMVEGIVVGGIAVSYKQAQVFTEEDASYWIAVSNLCAQSYARALQFEKERVGRRAAESASKAKNSFLANLSHELRTPMTVVIGSSELMSNELQRSAASLPKPLAEKLQTHAERCFRQGQMLARILEDVLDLSKIESGTIVVHKETIDVSEWLEDVEAIAKQLTAEKPVEVKLVLDPSTPKVIGTDSVRGKQILLNLVGNAAKFTDAGQILIHARGEVDFEGQRFLAVRIEDTGIGIDPSHVASIFNAFEKAKRTKHERGGQGLGLTIASQLASALGGVLRLVESDKGKGSTFEVKFRDLGTDSAMAINTSRAHIAHQTLKGYRVLVAEDEADIRDYLKEVLESAGATVWAASDGREAIEIAVQQTLDVAILDLQMPVIDGYEAAGHLTEAIPTLPLISLSAHGLREHRERAQSSGIKTFLVKPVDLPTLANAILAFKKSSQISL